MRTSSAVLVTCVVVLFLGLICGRPLSSVESKTRPYPCQWHAPDTHSAAPPIHLTLLPTCVLCGAFHAVCAATLLLAVQLLLCFAVATLWAHTEEEDEESQEGEGDALCYKVITNCDLKKHKQQQQQGEWASMAEEGRGLYEKLLSYT